MQNKPKTTEQHTLDSKKSFILYNDQAGVFYDLTDTEAGVLIKHIFKHVNEEKSILADRILKFVFEPIKNQLNRDSAKWKKSKEDKSNSGKLGNLKKWYIDLYNKVISGELNIEEAMDIVEYRKTSHCDTLRQKNIAKIAVNVNDNVNDNESVNETTPHSHFLLFDFYKTAYTELPIELQTTINEDDWTTWKLFNAHIDTKCKRIRHIPEQMNFHDYLEYRDRYIKSGLIDTLKLKSMLSKFNNCQSAQKYISVYDGLIDWTEREITYLKVV